MWKAEMIYCMCVPMLVCVWVQFLWEIFHISPMRKETWVNFYSEDVAVSHEQHYQ